MRFTFKNLENLCDNINNYDLYASYFFDFHVRSFNNIYVVYGAQGEEICRGLTPRECKEKLLCYVDGYHRAKSN